MSILGRLFGREQVPDAVHAALAADEHVAATATVATGGILVVTSWGIWTPQDPPQRLGWHEVSKATWEDGTLTVIAAEARETAGPSTVLLADLPPRRFRLAEPGKVPREVHERVTGSIRSRSHRELPGGGAWVLQRKVPGRDGLIVQVRPDPGTDPVAALRLAEGVAARLDGPAP